jgi:ubiquinone biosynthesis protein COQ9
MRKYRKLPRGRVFLTQWQMGEAKHSEAIANSVQKRNGTNHPLSKHIAWSCGCCIFPIILRDKTVATAEEADAILKSRKRNAPADMTMEEFRAMRGLSG